MKLNSIEANAHYDMAHGKPAVLEHDNDGSNLYRFNIEAEFGNDEEPTVQTGWKCREVRTFDKLTKANLKKAIIRSILDETTEFDLVNSYNKHILGIVKDDAAVSEYKDYLQFTEDLDTMLKNDLSN